MKNLKAFFIAAAALFVIGAGNNVSSVAQAQTIGYVNYKTVESNYEYAKQAYKETAAIFDG